MRSVQVDANVASAVINDKDANHDGALAWVNGNRAGGLQINPHTYDMLVAKWGKDKVKELETKYGITVLAMPEKDLAGAAARIVAAFKSTDRVIRPGARVAATALIKGEKLSTNDLQFFKRATDLGLNAEYVGSGEAAKKAKMTFRDPRRFHLHDAAMMNKLDVYRQLVGDLVDRDMDLVDILLRAVVLHTHSIVVAGRGGRRRSRRGAAARGASAADPYAPGGAAGGAVCARGRAGARGRIGCSSTARRRRTSCTATSTPRSPIARRPRAIRWPPISSSPT